MKRERSCRHPVSSWRLTQQRRHFQPMQDFTRTVNLDYPRSVNTLLLGALDSQTTKRVIILSQPSCLETTLSIHRADTPRVRDTSHRFTNTTKPMNMITTTSTRDAAITDTQVTMHTPRKACTSLQQHAQSIR